MKKTIVMCMSLFAGLLFMCSSSKAQTQQVQVTITGVKTVKGQLVLNIFKDQATYEREQPAKKIQVDKKKLVNGATVVSIPLEPGVYGITLLDDENSNGDMDRNVLKMPKEGFGFSNFYLEKMKRPTFEDFRIEVKASNDNKAVIKVKYM